MTSLVHRNYGNSPLSRFNRDEFLTPFDSIFDSLTKTLLPELHKDLGVDFFGKGSYPKVDIRDEESQLVIESEIPGLTRDQVKVEVEDGVLRLKGERRAEDEVKDKNYVHRELKRSSFCRSYVRGDNIDVDKVAADFKDGILTVTLPKLKPSPVKPTVKQIEVRSG
jgi:HSP20 family protein